MKHLVFCWFLVCALISSAAHAAEHYILYVGAYSGSKGAGKGVSAYHFDARTGQFTSLGLMADVANAATFAVSPDKRFLYVGTEIGDGADGKNGFLSSFAIDRGTGALKPVSRVPSGGTTLAHIGIDHTGRMLFAANFGSGSIAGFALGKDGSIGAMIGLDQHSGTGAGPRHLGPRPHNIVVSPDNHFLFTPDLGLDKIMSYRLDPQKRSFTPNDPPFVAVDDGFGPRHFTFSADGRFAYAACETTSHVVAFSYDRARGSLASIQSLSTLPPDFTGDDMAAEIATDRAGRFLYVSNRGHDSIAVFRIDKRQGMLEKIAVTPSGGKTPRTFALDPTGKYLVAANQDSGRLDIFRIDAKTGTLSPTGQVLDTPSPVSLVFVAAR